MIFSGFRAKFQKRVTSVAFQSILRRQIRRKLPKILKSVKTIRYYSILFIRVLNQHCSIISALLRVLQGADPLALEQRRGHAAGLEAREREGLHELRQVGLESAHDHSHIRLARSRLVFPSIAFRLVKRRIFRLIDC